jgi:hypothetical protein
MTMFTAQEILTIYGSFAFMCAMPWMFNWATHNAMPVTARLLALLIFSCALAEVGNVLWTVHDLLPERFGETLTVFFPMLFFSAVGAFLVAGSLVKIVKKSVPEDDDVDD